MPPIADDENTTTAPAPYLDVNLASAQANCLNLDDD
jgi:hypothetical protein